MKHSQRLLIALVALAAALALFFWPRSTAASPLAALTPVATGGFEQRCQKLRAPIIEVSVTPPTVVLKTDLSTRILSTRSRDASGNHSVMGMTAGHTLADVSLDGPTLLNASRTRECISPRIDVLLRFEPLDVYIAREFTQHSCAYREVLKHEMQHVKIYADGLARIERMVLAELTLRYGGKPHYAKAGQGLDSLHEQLNGWLQPMLREELAQVEVLQAQLDSTEETEILSRACLGEVAMMMGSSF
jgi:hypothetical protein